MDEELIWQGKRLWVETHPGEGGPCPQPPEGECVGEVDSKERARRIVACVNACEGMDDPAVNIAHIRAQLALSKGFLLESGIKNPSALGEVMEFLRGLDAGRDGAGWPHDGARALLAKLEGRDA